MPKVFDSAVKTLVALAPRGIPRLLNLAAQRVRPLDTDVSIVSGAMDAALLIEDESAPFVLHLEFQSSHDAKLLSRASMYHTIYHHQTQLDVQSVLVFLTEDAWRSKYGSGRYELGQPDRPRSVFEFQCVRVWELDREPLLADPGTLPLVALTRFDAHQHGEVLERIDAALRDHPDRRDLLAITHVLAGLRKDELQFAQDLNRRFPIMEDSLTYQEIRQAALKEGEERGAERGLHDAIDAFGTARFGEPDSATRDALEAIHDPERLQRLAKAVAFAESWADLLATP